MNNTIDFVITWVDGNDPAWLKERAAYLNTGGDKTEVRFRDWNLLRYWFRAVEQYTPWVNKIHFVTWGHIPSWLNTAHPKLHIVRHTDFIPAQYLPTFNSHVIELNMHRIEGLADQFVYFNDDQFITKPTPPDLFFKNGFPCDTFSLDCFCFATDTIGKINAANITVINDNFQLYPALKAHYRKMLSPQNGPKKVIKTLMLASLFHWFPGLFYPHQPCPYKLDTFCQVWDAAYDTLDETCLCRFRQDTNVSPFLMKYWQLASGNFTPISSKKYAYCYHITPDNLAALCQDIKTQKYNLLCANDTRNVTDWENSATQVQAAFERILPDKSDFEL